MDVISFDEIEHATVFAALRLYGRYLEANGGQPPAWLESVATGEGEFTPLGSLQIDQLCDRITSLEERASAELTVEICRGCLTRLRSTRGDVISQALIVNYDTESADPALVSIVFDEAGDEREAILDRVNVEHDIDFVRWTLAAAPD